MRTPRITAPAERPARMPVSRHDEVTFLARIGLAVALTVTGGFLSLQQSAALAVPGVLLLAAMFAHLVELTHQCLHHSGFRSSRFHRPVGVAMGLPLLVSYSHYRIRHLQHHKYLGTPKDTEFFGFDTRQQMTWGTLARGLFDYGRIFWVLQAVASSIMGSWTYPDGQIAPRVRRHIMTEYRLIGGLLLTLVLVVSLGHGWFVFRLWLVPYLIAIPLHFLIELPEHVNCDSKSTDVLLNTRSITGSMFSRWFTNSNNLHIEHHLSMTTPLQNLRHRHAVTRTHAAHVDVSYKTFYVKFLCGLARRQQGVESVI